VTTTATALPLPPLAVTAEQIAAFCRRHHIRWLAVFGSVLRDDFGPESDVDVLVEFEEGHSPGLEFVSMADELEEIVGRRVDFLTPRMLSRWLKPQVMREARVLYDAA
jgi:predicted nucleotidyltransferase